MASMYEKYQGVVSGDLGNVRQHIFKIKAQFSENKISHPKISAVCKEIETWLKKKQAKSRDKEQKMLILVKREMPTLLHCLQNALGLGKLISPGILSSPLSEDVIDALDQHNCLISPQRFITDTFPWVQFCLVVEYERVENSPWQQLCERQNIRHMDFQMELIDLTAFESLKTECKMKHPQYQITLIASQHISTNVPLLQLLEARFNILLVERNYSMFESSGHKCYFSDIDVDESTGIVQCDLADVGNDMKVQELVTKIAALSLKYMHLWVLVASLGKINSYQFPNHVISNISRLHAAVACLVHRKEDFSVKIIMCETIEEVAYYVRNISETGMETNTDRPWPEWLARKWISQDMTEKEKCFLSLPFMSSFNAQLVATNLTFAQIFAFSFDELVAKLKWIPRKILKSLNAFCNQKSGSENLQNAIAESAIPCEENELQNESIVVKETAFKQHKTETQTSPMYNNFASKSIPASDVDFSPKNADSSWRTNCRQPDERSVPRTSCPIQHGRRKCNSPGINVFGGEAFDESHSNGSVTDQSYNGLVFDNNHGCVFEYNHGLPQNSKKTLNEKPAVRHSSVGGGFSAHATGIQKHQGNALVGKISRKEFELEFPSAEEIDMAMRTERTDDSNDYRDHLQTNSISNNNLGFEIEHRNECAIALADITFDDRRVYDIPYVAYEEENAIEVGRCSRIGKLSENDAAPNWTHFTPQAVTAFTKNPSMDKLVKRFTDGAYQTDDFQKDSREMHNGTSDKKGSSFQFRL
ncbi:protein shortage in chiasmata 1 ortholog-like isoform X1 [Dreissena polymorpha]|uniref:protein shortage in chiasmata 1 ortholog-like isoform X1 n=1 Tax=Dreissena polymorpha TaxID=45954 RepID=UPI0022644D7F|nr:protein shortage in chiasmata 1 ortholog-like isoform X1 [Dreissena polymorpha]XP_052257481.1 protein shortage in chiasmata 1 ortholog-like isoform X1 [Dreissena polymorpha]XP_052257482.1 protein shortage in chiasmata 1 ortholog-like isoform X1 [Dreissena polymorpha]